MHSDKTYYTQLETHYGTIHLISSLDKIFQLELAPPSNTTLTNLCATTSQPYPQEDQEKLEKLQREVLQALQEPDHPYPEEIIKKLSPQGTAFQHKVWQALLTIPCGETRSYQEIAQLIKQPQATRAVATAIGKNPINYLIPCHRVIRSDGSLGGYRWGLAAKQKVLNYEKIYMDKSTK